MPSRSAGTLTASGPAETVTSTVEPTGALLALPGFVVDDSPSLDILRTHLVELRGEVGSSSEFALASSSVCARRSTGTGDLLGAVVLPGLVVPREPPRPAPSRARITRMISHQGLRCVFGSCLDLLGRCAASASGAGRSVRSLFQFCGALPPARRRHRRRAIAGSASVASPTGPSTVVACGIIARRDGASHQCREPSPTPLRRCRGRRRPRSGSAARDPWSAR